MAKVCCTCKQFKLASEFCRNRGKPDGLHSYCKPCIAAKERDRRATNPVYLAYQRSLHNAWCRNNRHKTKAWGRRYQFQSKYGLSMDEHGAMVARQDGRCAICTAASELVVDHDHATGVVRGMLCRTCNSGIGHLRDDVTLLRAAVRCLEASDVSQV